ncbi:MAG: ADP-ribosylglycohydrolase family protein, partial [Desulfovibrionaceae bacterium]|nr:ADP-ribosylglycohydrolase family protein [Desulfovibrionaceae bacterium]
MTAMIRTFMLGAILGDIAGSRYERDNIKHMPETLIDSGCRFTDDSVLTIAVAEGLLNGLSAAPASALMGSPALCARVSGALAKSVRESARQYPDAGYGRGFKQWFLSESSAPYGSRGNGAAMRVSPAGWLAG